MIGVELSMEIRVLAKHGKGVREIARDVGVSRNTVRRYLRDAEASRYKERPARPAKIDPFKDYIRERLAAAAPDLIPAKVLFDEIRERGYGGGYTMVKVFVATLKRSNAQTGAEAGAGCALRDDSGSANAGRLGDDPAGTEPVVGLRRDARLEPTSS